jgi:hypothetical protein
MEDEPRRVAESLANKSPQHGCLFSSRIVRQTRD